MLFARMNNAISHLLPQFCEHPLNRALLKGTLPRRVARFYLKQDWLYFGDLVKSSQTATKKLTSKKHADVLTNFSNEIIKTRENLFQKYLGEPLPFRLFAKEWISIEKIPVISAYTNHLLKTAQESPPAVAIASIIPCTHLYRTAGEIMIADPEYHKNRHNNPYAPLIESFLNQQFTTAGKDLVEIAEELGATSCQEIQDEMISACVKSTEYEILFLNEVNKKMDAVNEPLLEIFKAFR